MNVTLWDTSSDVRKELSIQDDRTESDNRIEVTLLIGITEINLPHIARWESTKPPYAEPHVRWCGRSVNVKIGGKCLLWLAFTSYPIFFFFSFSFLFPISLLPSLFSLLPSPISLLPFSFVISHFIVFLICHFSRLSHFVAQISANVNIYRINSSFLHIICAFLA